MEAHSGASSDQSRRDVCPLVALGAEIRSGIGRPRDRRLLL